MKKPVYVERELEDAYPVFQGYWYVTVTEDGFEAPNRSPIKGTVKDLKDLWPAIKKIRSCDMFGRGLSPAPWQGLKFGSIDELVS